MASEDVEKVKDRLNIADVVGQYVQLKKAGKNFTARCPFHKERTASFMVSPERGTYICFGCGERGDVFSFVQKMEGSDFPTVLKQLADKAGVKLQRGLNIRPAAEVEKLERLIEICNVATEFYKTVLKNRSDVIDYLKNRGVKEETIESWNLGYAPANWDILSKYLLAKNYSIEDLVDSGLSVKSDRKDGQVFDRFRGRVMFPISDSGGKVIAFSGRFFEKVPGQKDDIEPAKYINSPETPIFRKSRILYGYDRAHRSILKFDHSLLVEGQFDLILCHQIGLTTTVALSGTALTEEHLSRLGRLSKRLKLALDADNAGIRAGLKSAHMALRSGFEVKIPTLPVGKDPADLAKENPEGLKRDISTSKSAIEFFFDYLLGHNKAERDYKLEAQRLVLPLIAAISSPLEREHFIHLASQKLSVHAEVIQKEVQNLLNLPNTTYNPVQDTKEESDPIPPDAELTPLEKKAGMLVAYFAPHTPVYEELVKLLGADELQKIAERVAPHLELLRFRFEAELGEHTSESTVAQDMLQDIARATHKERFKMKFS